VKITYLTKKETKTIRIDQEEEKMMTAKIL